MCGEFDARVCVCWMNVSAGVKFVPGFGYIFILSFLYYACFLVCMRMADFHVAGADSAVETCGYIEWLRLVTGARDRDENACNLL